MEKLNKVKEFIKSEKFKIIFHYFIFPFLIVVLSDIYFKLSNGGSLIEKIQNTIFRSNKAFLITWLLIGIINALLISITNSARKSMIIIFTFFMILLPVNDFKFHIMGNPVKVSDVNFLNADNTEMMVDVMGALKGKWMIQTIIKTLISIAIFVGLILFEGKINFKFKSKKKRWISCGIFLVIFLLLVIPPKFLRSFYLNKVFNDEYKRDYRRNTSNAAVYLEYGWIQGLYYSHLGDYIMPPEHYNKEETDENVESVISEIDKSEKDWGKPNVVFILSESFWDISQLEEYEFNVDLTSNLKRLDKTNRCLSMDMLSPSYGGASVNVEFEMLTGGSINYFNNGYVPYLQLYKNNKNAKNMPNLIKEFNDEGYITKYISSWGRTSYNSEKVFDIIGTDESIYEDELKNVVKKGNIADSYMMDVILDELKEKTEERKFLFVTTAQNHMPYSKYRYNNYDVEIKKSSLNQEFDDIAVCFAQGVYDADKEFGRLFDEIQKIDEPTVVVFFGDHLPYLVNNSGESMVDYTTYFNTGNSDLDYVRQHQTQSLIITNFDIEKDDSLKMVNASYIGSYVMNKMSFNKSKYFKYIEEMRKKLPVYTDSWIYRDGKFTDIQDLSNEEEKLYDDKKKVQYRYFIDNN